MNDRFDKLINDESIQLDEFGLVLNGSQSNIKIIDFENDSNSLIPIEDKLINDKSFKKYPDSEFSSFVDLEKINKSNNL